VGWRWPPSPSAARAASPTRLATRPTWPAPDRQSSSYPSFPGSCLGLGGAGSPSRERAREKLDQAIRLYNAVGRLAAPAGVPVNVHPHSHYGSLLETAEEYQYLLDRLDPAYVSFGPDTGHIVRGGQDLLACLRTHLPRITHLHLKDATAAGEWVALGEGICDYPAVMRLLESAGYRGWVVGEEESPDARADGIAAIRKNRAYLRGSGTRSLADNPAL